MIGSGGWGAELPYVMVHETGHCYWRAGQSWINEGAANFLVYISEREWDGQEAANAYAARISHQCHQLDNIAALEKLKTVPEHVHFACSYEFGVQLFVDLHDMLGEATFPSTFRDLYLKRKQDDPSAGRPFRMIARARSCAPATSSQRSSPMCRRRMPPLWTASSTAGTALCPDLAGPRPRFKAPPHSHRQPAA